MSGSPWRQPADRLGYVWLGVGTVLSLFAVDGRWDVAPAAWLSGVFLLRYTRTRRVLSGFIGIWVASAVGAAFFLYESGLDVFGPILLLCLLLGTVLAVPYVVDRLLAPRLNTVSAFVATLAFPLARVGAEYAIATLSPAGNIYGSLAATQQDNLPLLQIAAVTGSYGITFLIAWFAAVCNGAWELGFSWPRMRSFTVAYAIVLTLVVIGGGVRLAVFPASATATRVAGVSPPASAMDQRSTDFRRFTSLADAAQADPAALRPLFTAVNDGLLAASEREARAGARVIAWPEVGASVLAGDKANLIARAGALARNHRVYLAMGLSVLDRQAPYLRNQAILLDPDGNVVWTYDKTHPVPALDDLTPGDGRLPTVDTPYGRIATVICFDADFPTLMRQGGRQGVDLMLVPSNDWREFGKVHARKATIRAIENGYSVVRPATNGLAQTVDYQGHVLASSDYYTNDQQTMVAHVPSKGVRTIYGSVGDVFAWLCLAVLGVLVGLSVSMAIRSRTTQPRQPLLSLTPRADDV